jgi:hypothetical protein
MLDFKVIIVETQCPKREQPQFGALSKEAPLVISGSIAIQFQTNKKLSQKSLFLHQRAKKFKWLDQSTDPW